GHNRRRQTALYHESEPAGCPTFGHDHYDFLTDALRRNPGNRRRFALDCGPGSWLYGKIETRGETDGPQQPQMVFAKALIGVANRANHACPQIPHAAHEV